MNRGNIPAVSNDTGFSSAAQRTQAMKIGAFGTSSGSKTASGTAM